LRVATRPRAGAHHVPLLDEKRLDDVLDRAALLAEGRRQAVDAYRAAAELLDDSEHEAPIHRVEALWVDIQQVERRLRDRAGDVAGAAHLGVVAHPTQQPVGDARRTA
jgi:hypothetical protein